MKTKKGFTLVELLVVIGIIALLMSILMPALAKVKAIAVRLVCGNNLKDLGKACFAYANDNKDQFPVSGGPGATWSSTGDIVNYAGDKQGLEPLAFGSPPAPATMTSALYLLIKYQNSAPSQFNCGGDVGYKEFKLSYYTATSYQGTVNSKDMAQLFDFGRTADLNNNLQQIGPKEYFPGCYVSYAYHMPFKFTNPLVSQDPISYPIYSLSPGNSPLMADRNPWCDRNARGTGTTSDKAGPLCNRNGKFNSNPSFVSGNYTDQEGTGNSVCHQRDGQNVLFADGSNTFAKYPNVGIENDHIYLQWTVGSPTPFQRQGSPSAGGGAITWNVSGSVQSIASNSSYGPLSSSDAFLVNEYNGDPVDMK